MKGKLDDFDFSNFEDIVKAFDWVAKMPTPIRDWANKNYFDNKQKSANLQPETIPPVSAIKTGDLEYLDGHINLYSEDGTYKWSISYFVSHSDGWDLKFVGKRPFDARVDWDEFQRLIWVGYKELEEEDGI